MNCNNSFSPNSAESPPYGLAVALDLIPGSIATGQSGKSIGPVAGPFSTIWDGNPLISPNYIPPTADRIHTITSSMPAQDAPGGSGVSTLRVEFVSSITDGLQYEDILVGSAMIAPASHINSMTAIGWGNVAPTLTAVGNISAVAAGDGTTTALLLAGRNNTLTGVLQIPRDKRFSLPGVAFSLNRDGGSTTGAQFRFIRYKQGVGFLESIDIGLDDTSPIHTFVFDPPYIIGPDEFLAPQVKPQAGGGGAITANVIYRGILSPL